MDEGLCGRRILIVEDEYLLATDLADFLQDHGAGVVGPVGNVPAALGLVQRERLDGAVLDINLRNELVYPVADALLERGVPVVFCTGYEELLMRRDLVGLPRCRKPVDHAALLQVLTTSIAQRG
jgi:CheY-like chemotaxis protein